MDGKSLGWNNEEEDKRGRLALYMLGGKGLKIGLWETMIVKEVGALEMEEKGFCSSMSRRS